MLCVSCGLEIDPDPPSWAVYAWDAFDLKTLEAMAMHEACFDAGEEIEGWEWQNDPVTNEAVLVSTGMQTRLLRSPGEGMYIWSIDPETNEGALVPYVARGGRRA